MSIHHNDVRGEKRAREQASREQRTLTENQIVSALHRSLEGRPLGSGSLIDVSALILEFSLRLGYYSDKAHLDFAKRVVATPHDE